MLIHVSRYLNWQNSLKEIINNLFLYYKRGIEQEDKGVLKQFRDIFEVDTENYISYCTTTQNILNSSFKDIDSKIKIHSWEDIKPNLYKAVQKIKIMSINGQSTDTLEYYENEKTGISVIAIGGDKLSRGLTLEGLSVSYFLRASKMYDTLMQMGRWFGYRPDMLIYAVYSQAVNSTNGSDTLQWQVKIYERNLTQCGTQKLHQKNML